MLVLAREHGAEETVALKFATQRRDGRDVCPPDRVAGQAQPRIHAALCSDHQRQRQVVRLRSRQHALLQNARQHRVGRIAKAGRKRHRQVKRLHPFDPVRQESPQLAERKPRGLAVHPIAQSREPARARVARNEELIQPQRGTKPVVHLERLGPARAFRLVKRIVRHHDRLGAAER